MAQHTHPNRDLSPVGELDRIAQIVEQRLLQPQRVSTQPIRDIGIHKKR